MQQAVFLPGIRVSSFSSLLGINYPMPVAGAEWKEQSIRVEFPKEIDPQVRSNKLTASVCTTLEKRGLCLVRRLGLSATDFEVKAKNSIETFFVKHSTKNDSPYQVKKRITEESSTYASATKINPLMQAATGSQSNLNHLSANQVSKDEESNCPECKDYSSIQALNLDLEYARKLQDSYDKEYSILSSIRPLELKELPPPMQTKTKIQKFFEPQKKIKLQEPDKDFEYAKKLQAAYDRENSLLSSFKRGLGKKK